MPARQAAVVGGEDDVERGRRRRARSASPSATGASATCSSDDQVAPVAERRRAGSASRPTGWPRTTRFATRRAGRVARRVAVAFARAGDAVRRDLAVEERDAEHVADRLRAGVPVARDETLDESAPVRDERPVGRDRRSRPRRPSASAPGAVAAAADGRRAGRGRGPRRPCAPAETTGGSRRATPAPVAAAAQRPGEQEQASEPHVHAAPLSGSARDDARRLT